jgi:hypothetical protein
MAKKPEPPPKSITWNVYKIAAKQLRPGTVEAAADEREAIWRGQDRSLRLIRGL